jgi:SPX domain protein involved in polyphosphate accumulation
MDLFQSLPPVLERYELKYTVPAHYIEPISDFISAYCALDKHSTQAQANNYFYQVNSLYFDTPGHEFLKQRIAGKTNRFNMRVRTYDDGSKAPYFLEIKYRPGIVGVIRKYRATAQAHEWPRILTDPGYRVADTDAPKEKATKELFLRLAISYAIEPKILTKYQRRAFFSTVDEYARVTLDTNMQYRVQNEYDTLSRYDMTHYDNETIYTCNTRSDANVILELKCLANEVPYWMLALIKRFELKQQGFSKYLNSALVSHFDNGNWFMPFDRGMGFAHEYL